MVERRENKQTSSSYELYFEARRRSFAFVMEIHLSSKGIYLRPWAKAPTLATTGGFDSETPGAERESAAGSRAVASEADFLVKFYLASRPGFSAPLHQFG
jgi:hypothetical protein